MKQITGCGRGGAKAGGDVDRANQLNNFYNRFDDSAAASPNSSSSHLSLPLLGSALPFSHPLPTGDLPPHSHLSPSPLSPSSSSTTPPPTITTDQVRWELRRMKTKAAGPDGVHSRMLKACAGELGEPLQHVFNMSLRLGRVASLWKTSCIIPVPKKPHPKELNNFRPVALTSHLMKTLERLLLRLLRPQVRPALDPLQFENVGVKDAILYMLHLGHTPIWTMEAVL